jgi:hypothetical protein
MIKWQFKTKRFEVRYEELEECDPDFSWDEDGSALAGVQSGEFDLFLAKVSVRLDGQEIAADYLGNCIYKPDEFHTTYKHGHYFSDMVRTTIAEARENIRAAQPLPYVREAA